VKKRILSCAKLRESLINYENFVDMCDDFILSIIHIRRVNCMMNIILVNYTLFKLALKDDDDLLKVNT